MNLGIGFIAGALTLAAQGDGEVDGTAIDFHVAEAVNLNQMVYGMIPKVIFKK